MQNKPKARWILLLLMAIFLVTARSEPVAAYPIDGADETGIVRLEAYFLAQKGKVKGRFLYPGALLPTKKIQLKLLEQPDFQIPPPDPELTGMLHKIINQEHAKDYGIVILDLADPKKPRYAELNPDLQVNPGSVGKILVGLGIFQTLADIYPDSIDARFDILKNTTEVTDEFSIRDTHGVPFWQPGDEKIIKRPIRPGDAGNLWTFLDWMLSSSSNGAASMLQKNLLLMHYYGKEYPRPLEEMNEFLKITPKKELKRIFAEAIQGPIAKNGLDLTKLRQGSFFTRTGKSMVPGTNSYMTSREMLNLLIRMEQGKLVDHFSSLSLKRLLYLTDRRIRYAASGTLRNEAVYFKSGSLYSCKPEPDFVCQKYKGNKRNLMNSIAIVESIDRDPGLQYMVVLVSNVLRENSAFFHMTIGSDIHKIMEKLHPIKPKPATQSAPLKKPKAQKIEVPQ